MIEGTIVNGRVELDEPAGLPDGTRVAVDVIYVEDEDDFGPPPPYEPYDREKELALLREAHEDVLAGRVRPAREVLKEIALRNNLPLEPGE